TFTSPKLDPKATPPVPLEPETVNPASPSISTTPGAAVVLGSGNALNDTAILSGGSNYLSGDTITFTLYAPNLTTVVYTDTVPVTGNGTYSTTDLTGNHAGG